MAIWRDEQQTPQNNPLPYLKAAEWGHASNRDRILLADDTPSMLKFMKEGLEAAGYSVVTAVSGNAAYEEYAKDSKGFRFVITDKNMPNGDGPTLIRRVKVLNPAQHVVLATIGASTLPTKTKVDIGADAYYDKTGQKDLSGLLAILRALERQRN
jgi:two-component system, OmpR family, response regulator